MTYNRLTRIGELVREMAEAHDPHTVNVAHGKVLYELEALRLDLESADAKEPDMSNEAIREQS